MNKVIAREYVEKNYVHKDQIREIIEKHKRMYKLAQEQISPGVCVVDSDSLNNGRLQAHKAAIFYLQELL